MLTSICVTRGVGGVVWEICDLIKRLWVQLGSGIIVIQPPLCPLARGVIPSAQTDLVFLLTSFILSEGTAHVGLGDGKPRPREGSLGSGKSLKARIPTPPHAQALLRHPHCSGFRPQRQPRPLPFTVGHCPPLGGRGVSVGPILSSSASDIFCDNENGPNFLFHNRGDGTFVDAAASAGECGRCPVPSAPQTHRRLWAAPAPP